MSYYKDELVERDITCEQWREYEFGGITYRIEEPVKLYYRIGGATHRVLTKDGVAHCVPRPGADGCVLRWKNFPGRDPVNF